ncbi:hypothetical protein M422DRAFT_42403 [Sphaerobolus stellatus SS14]|nr:hypothetical protein M422DRAFT_42403 [Sphaerobolus stellatus SS14]
MFRTELEGLWYYRAADLEEGVFHKHRIILDRSVSEFDVDDMTFTNKMDLVAVETRPSAGLSFHDAGLKLYSNVFKYAVFQPYLSSTASGLKDLILTVSNSFDISSTYHELPIFRTFSFEFSLLVIPPMVECPITKGLPEGIKVLYGMIEVKSRSGKWTKRGMALPLKSKRLASSLYIHGDIVRGGSKGAIVLHLKPICQRGVLKVENVIPDPYPSHIRRMQFLWKENTAKNNFSLSEVKAYTLDGFRLRIEGNDKDIAHVHFTAIQDKTSTSIIPLPTPLPPTQSTPLVLSNYEYQPITCQVRCCIVNGTNSAGVCIQDDPKSGTTFGHRHRLTTWVVPTMSEIRRLWDIDKEGLPILNNGIVWYRKNEWVSHIRGIGARFILSYLVSPAQELPEPCFDVCMDVDFAPFKLEVDDNTHAGISFEAIFLLLLILLVILAIKGTGFIPWRIGVLF